MNAGVLYAFGAYFAWGLFPLYFSLLASVNALEVLAVRVPVSLLCLFAVLGLRRHWQWLVPALREPRVMRVFAGSTLAISVNWYVVIWASTHDHIVDAALGYFINPLVNVLIGYFVLKEPLSRLQLAALLLAGLAVGWLTWHAGSLPWISLTLAFSFALYGLLRRRAPLGALEGLTLETLLLTPIALVGLA
ncbi:MAG: EamA family transporter RarD, partial [Burkholderiales bacterium]